MNPYPEYNKHTMTTEKNPRSRLARFFAPSVEGSTQAMWEILPFFILLTLVMAGMYIMAITNSIALNNPIRFAFFSFLFLLHLLLYWMILHFALYEQRAPYYVFIQGSLAFVLILLSGNVNLVIGLYASLTGTTVGTFGRKRITLFAVIFYTVLAFVSILLVGDLESFNQIILFFVVSILFSAFFAYAFFRQIEAREQAQSLLMELEKAHQQLAEYALEVEDLTLANERQRMARDLHDTLAQGLAGLILQLEAAVIHIEEKHVDTAHEILQQALARARSTLVDARRAIDDLRFESSDPRHLAEGITREVARFNNATGIPCELVLDLPDMLSDEVSEHIFRTVTEGLGNIARHAQANQVGVEISQADNLLNLRIWDDGTGFAPDEEMARSGHYGLLGIRERARLAGGTLSIDSSPGKGTRLDLSLPLGEKAGG
jgi:NarL family two-component system sensor histidine kinase YdfH